VHDKGYALTINKEYIINEKIDCFHYLESYELSKDDALLQEQLISLVRVKDLAELYGNKFASG
jgi:hypothetical protein